MYRIPGRSAVGIAIGLLALTAGGQSAGSLPRVTGYVTQVDSTGFFADGDLVETTSKTQFYTIEAGRKRQVDALPSLYLGEPIEIWGKFRDKHSNVIIAQVIHVTPPHSGPVAGLGIILVAESNPAAAERMLIADGYRLHLTPHTHLELDPPLKSLADLGPNCWLGYRGVQGADGTVEVSDALGCPTS